MKLSLKNITKLLITADNMNSENILKQRWILHYEKEMSFDDFKNKLMGNIKQNNNNTKTEKTAEQIIKESENILASLRG